MPTTTLVITIAEIPAGIPNYGRSEWNHWTDEGGDCQDARQGVWVNHEDVNPATGEIEDKHFWLVEHDGLVFGSGCHHDESGD